VKGTVLGRERILGIPYDNVTTEEVLQRVELLFKDEKSHVVTFLTLPAIMLSRKSKFLRIFLEEADLIVPCGKHVYWAARFLRHPLREIIDPSQLTKLLMMQSYELSKSIYLFGGKDRIVDQAFENLKREFPRLFIIGRHRVNYPRKAHENVVAAIGKASPDYLFVGMTTPQGERWIEQQKNKLHARVIVMIGGLLDVFAGSVRKARSYRELLAHAEGGIKTEVPQSYGLRRLFWRPFFVIAVFFEKLVWKH
jgi:N-acetylglucosaminyldiphosphoundecaprenol N-acetyl-beta-D-mannosaminyltransferase